MKNQFIGVLSGTSMDAVDVALVSFETLHPQLLATTSYPIPEEFRSSCLSVSHSGHCSVDDLCRLNIQAGELFAEAILHLLKETGALPSQIRAIGSHGQTLRHRPDLTPPFSLQIGDPNIIVERTGIPTIADFRARDIAAGGQGAPLAPAFHASVFGSESEHRVILNIGGISNITVLPAAQKKSITGFDTGPGNCLLDAWVAQQHADLRFDANGEFAKSGQINARLLEICLDDPYFSKQPPKSSGREYFNLAWLSQKIDLLGTTAPLKPTDVQATLVALTARSITQAILEHVPSKPQVFVCGGGAHNRFLIDTLAEYLQRPIHSTEALGISPDWVEAILFAWLAKQTLEGKSGNCPAVTGARSAAILGGIFGYHPALALTRR